MSNTRGMRTATMLVLAGWLLVGCGQDVGPAGPAGAPRGTAAESEGGATVTRSGLCAAELEYADHHYVGHGDLLRDPATTGRVESGTATGADCDLSREIEVAELAGVSMERAVLAEGTVYVRADRPFPEAARVWFSPVRCTSDGELELSGDWLGVQSPNAAAFDGDLRPPFRVEVHVTEGPADYRGARVTIRATEATDPTLGPSDVQDSLHEGGGLTAVVRCAGGGFVATALTSTPG